MMKSYILNTVGLILLCLHTLAMAETIRLSCDPVIPGDNSVQFTIDTVSRTIKSGVVPAYEVVISDSAFYFKQTLGESRYSVGISRVDGSMSVKAGDGSYSAWRCHRVTSNVF